MDQISCPICNRDYELPKRYMKSFDDYDFLPIPRLQACLHTVCHSCLEAIRENNTNGEVCCPICKKKEIVKGVRYIPLDISVLKQIANVNGTEIMSVCCKCYENVPSVSWCDTCSSAFCDLHHTDHKFGIDTAKHSIHTFKDITYRNLKVEFKFPPISCPESPLCDCSLYCHDCMHLISSDAMINKHKTHNVESYRDVVKPMRATVQNTVKQSTENNTRLKDKISEIKATLQALDQQEETSIISISKTFNTLHKKLKQREHSLREKLNTVIDTKRTLLLSQLSTLSETYEDSKHALQTSELLLKNTGTSDTLDKHSNDSMYLVSAAETVDFHCDTLTEVVSDKIAVLYPISTEVVVDFVTHETELLNNIIVSYGGVQYVDDVTVNTQQQTALLEITSNDNDSSNNNTHLNSSTKIKDSMHSSDTLPLVPQICFSINVEDSITDGHQHTNHNTTRNSNNNSTHQSSVNSSSGSGGNYKTNQFIVVEARLLSDSSNKHDVYKQQSTPNDVTTLTAVATDQLTTLPNSRGALLGKVVINTNIDRRLLNRHELHSYFESTIINHLPTMHISKEFVPSR